MDVLFCAELHDLKTVHNVLKAINFKEVRYPFYIFRQIMQLLYTGVYNLS